MTQIICLANSIKRQERCIAGIDPETGKWIRPIYKNYPDNGRVPRKIRLINGEEPALLDILDIPLEDSGLDFGFESENRNIAQGQWRKVGQASPQDVVHFASRNSLILHNSSRYVTLQYLQSLPPQQRRTLQLVYVDQLLISSDQRVKLIVNNSCILEKVKITDPILLKKLYSGYQVSGSCLVTISLSMPFRPDDSWEFDPCWKLVAGVIEL
jgi:hypothetical protein